MQTTQLPRRALSRRLRQKFLAVVVTTLVASTLVIAGPGQVDLAEAQIGAPIDCTKPGDDVMVLTPESFAASGVLIDANFPGGRYALMPGRYKVSEAVTVFNDVEIISCDPNARAVLVAVDQSHTLRFQSFFDPGTPLSVWIQDINFEMGTSNGVAAFAGIDLTVERVTFSAIGGGSAVVLTDGAAGILRDVAISGAVRGVSAPSSGDVDIERVTITNTSQYGIYIEGDSEKPQGLRPNVSISELTVLDTTDDNGAGVYLGSGVFKIENSTIACSRNANLRMSPSAVMPETSSLTSVNLDLGSRPGGVACGSEQRFGLSSSGELAIDWFGGNIVDAETGVAFVESSGDKLFNVATIAGNKTGLTTDSVVELRNQTFSGNDRDCRVTEGLIISDSSDAGSTDGTCVANPGPSGIDCAVPPIGARILSPGDDIGAALADGGTILLAGGTFQVSIEQTISKNVELASCDPTEPATLTQISRCQRVLLLRPAAGAVGLVANVHDLIIEGGSAGLTATEGVALQAERVQLRGLAPFCDDNDRALEVSAGSTAVISDVQIIKAQWGAWFQNSGDVTLTNVTVDRSEDYGVRVDGTAGAANPPTITLTNTTVTNTATAAGIGSGVVFVDANAVVTSSTIACNPTNNVLAVTRAASTIATTLRVDTTTVGRFGDSSTCTEFSQAAGVRTERNVSATIVGSTVVDHAAGSGIVIGDGAAVDVSSVENTLITGNDVGLQVLQKTEVSGTQFASNGTDCKDPNDLLIEAGHNEESDGTCFGDINAPQLTLAPSDNLDGFSQATTGGQTVLRIQSPLGLPTNLEGAAVSEFVITSPTPAPAGGLPVEWRFEGNSFANYPAADATDLVTMNDEPLAAAPPDPASAPLDDASTGFVSSPFSVTIPEGERSVTVRVVPTVDLDPAEALTIGLVDSDAILQAVIEPTDYEATVPDLAGLIVPIEAGDTYDVEVTLTPAVPHFADPVNVEWTITGSEPELFVGETSGTLTFTGAEGDPIIAATQQVVITANDDIADERELLFELTDGNSFAFVATPAPVGEPLRLVPGEGASIQIDDVTNVQTMADELVFAVETPSGLGDRDFTWSVFGRAGEAIPASDRSDFVEPADLLSDGVNLEQPLATGTGTTDSAGDAVVVVPISSDLDAVEGFEIRLDNGQAPLPGVIAPNQFVVSTAPVGSADLLEGEVLRAQVTVSPGWPDFLSGGFGASWAISGDGADAFSPAIGTEPFDFNANLGDTFAEMTREVAVPTVDDSDDTGEREYGFVVTDESQGSVDDLRFFGTVRDNDRSGDPVYSVRVNSLSQGAIPGIPGAVVDVSRGLLSAQFEIFADPVPTEDQQVTWEIRNAEFAGMGSTSPSDFVSPADPVDDQDSDANPPSAPDDFGGFGPPSPFTIPYPAGASSVVVTIKATQDQDPAEAFEVAVVGSGEPLKGFIAPNTFAYELGGDSQVVNGEVANLTITRQPAIPFFAAIPPDEVAWAIPSFETDFGTAFAGASGTQDFAFDAATDTLDTQTRTVAVSIPAQEPFLLPVDLSFELVEMAVDSHQFQVVEAPEPEEATLQISSDAPTVTIGDDDVLFIGQTQDNPGSSFDIVLGEPAPFDGFAVEWELRFESFALVAGSNAGDFVTTSGSALFAQDQRRLTVPITSKSRADEEPPEAVQITLRDSPAASLQAITDAGTPSFGLELVGGSDAATEGDDLAFEITMTPGIPYLPEFAEGLIGWQIEPDASGGAGTSAADFGRVSGDEILRFDASATPNRRSTVVTVPIIENDDIEPEEGFAVALNGGSEASVQGVVLAQDVPQLITADLAAGAGPRVQAANTELIRVQGNAATSFTVNLSEPAPPEGVNVRYELVFTPLAGFAAASASDFSESSGTAPFGDGEVSIDVPLDLTSRGPGAAPGTFQIKLTDFPDAAVLSAVTEPGTLQFDAQVAPPRVSEDGLSELSVVVTPAVPFFDDYDAVPISWKLEPTTGSTNAADDWTQITGSATLDLRAGATSFALGTLQPVDDDLVEDDEAFDLTVGRTADIASLETSAQIVLEDNDEPPVIPARLVPGSGPVVFAEGIELLRVADQPTFVIELDQPAPAGGVFVTWQIEPESVELLPAADASSLVLATDDAFIAEGLDFVEVTIDAFEPAPGAEPGSFRIRLPEHEGTELFGVTEPGAFQANTAFIPDTIIEGQSTRLEIAVQPAVPYFDDYDVLQVGFDLGGVSGTADLDLFPARGTEQLTFDETEFLSSQSRKATVVVTAVVDGLWDFGVQEQFDVTVSVDGEPIDGLVGLPLTIIDLDLPPQPNEPTFSVRPTRGEELTIGEATVIELNVDSGVVMPLAPLAPTDGDPEANGVEGFVVELNEPATEQVTISWTITGAQVGLAVPADPSTDVATASGTTTIAAGQQAAIVELVPVGEATPSPVEGFAVEVTIDDETQSLGGIIQPHLFQVAFVPRAGTDLDPMRAYPEVPVPGTFVVAEGFDLAFDVIVTPGDPYNFGAGLLVPWTINDGEPGELGDPGFAGADDFSATVADEVEFTFDANRGDTAVSMTRLVLLPVAIDAIDDDDEIAMVALNVAPGPESYLEGAVAIGRLIDVEVPVVLTAAPTTGSAISVEGEPALEAIPGDSTSFVVSTNQDLAEDREISWSITGTDIGGLTPTGADDFVSASGTATIAAGANSVTITIQALADRDSNEPAEGFAITVDGVDSPLPGVVQPGNVQVTVTPVDGRGAVAVGSEAQPLAFDVTMTPARAFSSFSLPWSLVGDQTFGDGATSASDFATTADDIDFVYAGTDTPDSATRRVTIAVTDDGAEETDEGFKFQVDDTATFGFVVASPAGSPGEPADPDDASVPFGGLKLDDVEGDVQQEDDGASGELRGKFKLPEWPDEIPVTIVFDKGRATVTYDDTFDDVELGEPPFLRIDNPRVVASASAGLDGSMEAQITITADSAAFFPETDGGPIATATALAGVVNTDGTIRFTTDQIAGTFADLEVALNDVAVVLSDKPTVPLISVANVETVDGVNITGIRVFRDGRVEVAEACVTDENDLVGRIGIAGLGFTLEEACLRTAETGVQTFDVTGLFDAELIIPGVGNIVSGVAVGEQPEDPNDEAAQRRASFVLTDESGSFVPETLGPIVVDLGPFTVAGLTGEGSITAPGWTNSVLDQSVSGELAITGSNLLLDDADIAATVQGTIETAGSVTTMDLRALASGQVSLADGLVVINEGQLGIDFAIESVTSEAGGVAAAEISVEGPTLKAADLAATITIPGIDDVDGDPVQVDAAVNYDVDEETWTVTVEATDAAGWDFGIWSLNQISGEVVLDPEAPIGAQIDGEFMLLANLATATDDVVATLALEVNDTTTPGEYRIALDSTATWTGSGIEGFTLTNGQIDVTGEARVNLVNPGFGVDAFEAVGSFDRATLVLGEFLAELTGTTVRFDDDATTPFLQAQSVLAGLTDPDNPQVDLITLTIDELTINDDGSVAVGAVAVSNIDNLTTSFGLNGILPFTLERLEASFDEPGNFDSFVLRAVGQIDLRDLGGLDVRAAQGAGAPASCDVETNPVIPFDFSVAVDSLSQGDITPQDVRDISIAVCNVDLGGVLASASVSLGGYIDGELVPEASAVVSIESAGDVDSPLTGAAEIAITGTVFETGDGAVLRLGGSAIVSGALDDTIVVQNASINFALDVNYVESTDALTIENARAFDAEAEFLRIAVGDVLAFEARNARVFPAPGVIASFIGEGDESSVSVVFGEDLDILSGWGGSAGNFSILADADGLDVEVQPSFFVTIDAPADADIGLPDWLPLVITEVGVQWPEITEPSSLFTLLEDISTSQVLVSGGLVGSENGFPFTAQVEGLVIDLAVLGRWTAGDLSESPIVDLEGVLLGVAPRDWGPARVGGGLALGYVADPNTGEPIWYGRLFGEFGIDGLDLGLDMVMSQYGPIAASFRAPAAIPLGPTGLLLSGVSGGLDFERTIPALPIDCGTDTTTNEFVCADGSSPLSLLTDPAYDFETPRSWTFDELQQSVLNQAERGGSFLPNNVTMYIGGDLTHAAVAGAISGQVRLAANLDGRVESQGLRLLGTGSVSVFGVEGLPTPPPGQENVPGGLAGVGVLLDLSDPIAPAFTVAMEFPKGDDWLAAAFPGQARFGVTVDTEGFALGLATAMRTFLEELAADELLLSLVEQYAATLDANRSLAINGLLGIRNETRITRDVVIAQVRAVIEGGDPTLAAEVAQAVFSDLLESSSVSVRDTATQGLATTSEAVTDVALAVKTALLDAMQAAAEDLLETANPSLLAQGEAQMKLLGIPFGSPQGSTVFIDKEQFFFEATGSITDTLRSSCPIPACAEALYLLSLGTTDTITLGLGIPINAESLIDGSAFETFDPFGSPWRANAGGSLSMFGFPLANANGVMLGRGQPAAVAQELSSDRYTIPVPASAQETFVEHGGLLLEANLQLPGFLTDPATRLAELGKADCFEFPADLVEIPGWFGRCVDETTEAETVGALQMFVPGPPAPGETNWDVDQMYVRGQVNGSLLSLPLGDMQVEATTAGFSVTARPPLVPDTSTTQWLFEVGSRAVEGGGDTSFTLPTVGFEGGLTSDDLTLLLDTFGLGDVVDLSDVTASIDARGYSTGFDPDSGDALKVSGGIEIEATAGITNLVDEASFNFSLTPRAPRFDGELLPFDLQATALITNASLGGVTISSGIASITVIDGVVSIELGVTGSAGEFNITGEILGTVSPAGLSGSFAGSVTLPAGLAGTNRVAISAAGDLATNGDFTLTLAASDVDLGPLEIDGQMSLRRRGDVISLRIDAAPGDSDGRANLRLQGPANRTLVSGSTGGITVASDGRLVGDIRFDQIGDPSFVALTGVRAQINANFGPPPTVGRGDTDFAGPIPPANSVNDEIFNLAISTGSLQVGFLASEAPGSFPSTSLGGLDAQLVIQRDGDFTLSARTRPVDLGILRLEQAEAAVSFTNGVLKLEADLGASVTLGDDVSQVELREFMLDSRGNVRGTLAGRLRVLGSELASINVSLNSVRDRPGVLRFEFVDVRLGGADVFGGLEFEGFVQTDGQFDLSASMKFGGTLEIPFLPPLTATANGTVRVRNTGASFAGTATFEFGPLECSGSVELEAFDDPGLLGNVATTCFGTFGFAWPPGFVPDDVPDTPVWVYVPDTITISALPGPFEARYDLPAARNATVACFPAPGATIFGDTTVSCNATSPAGETITASFDIEVEPLIIEVAGGLPPGVTAGDFGLAQEPEETGSTGTTIFLVTAPTVTGRKAMPIKQVNTSGGNAVETKKGEGMSGVTTALLGTKVKGVLESDPITVFEVDVDADGNARWRFAIPDEIPAGEHTLYISGMTPVGELFTDVIPIFVTDDRPTLFPRPAVSPGTAVQPTAPTTAEPTTPATTTTTTSQQPLAHTGFAGHQLLMVGLWLLMTGSTALGLRRIRGSDDGLLRVRDVLP